MLFYCVVVVVDIHSSLIFEHILSHSSLHDVKQTISIVYNSGLCIICEGGIILL